MLKQPVASDFLRVQKTSAVSLSQNGSLDFMRVHVHQKKTKVMLTLG